MQQFGSENYNDLTAFLPPDYSSGKSSKSEQIAATLYDWFSAQNVKQGNKLTTPPFAQLVQHFEVTYLELFDALRFLRDYSLDYQLNGVEEAIILWQEEREKL